MKIKFIAGILILAYVAATCSSSKKAPPIDEWREEATGRVLLVIEQSVEDAARLERALRAAERFRVADEEYATAITSMLEKLREIHQNYDSTRQDFEVWAEQFARTRSLYRGRTSANFDALKGALTADEWALVWNSYENELKNFEKWYQ